MKTSAAKFLMVILMISGLMSCAHVKPAYVEPWERDILARDQMMPDPHPAFSSIRSHMYESREASGRLKPSGSGSACGCY